MSNFERRFLIIYEDYIVRIIISKEKLKEGPACKFRWEKIIIQT